MRFVKKSASRRIFTSILLLCVAIFAACRSLESADVATNAPASNEADFSVPGSTINLAKPLVISPRAEDIWLAKRIDDTIEQSEFANARWGVFVVSLKDGRVVVGRDARKLFNPASIEKTLTSIVALDKLGADFRWRTSVYGATNIENGILDGDLTLYGRGAPDFDEAGLQNLINQLAAKNLKEIKGDIVGDESYFEGDDIGDGWTWNDLQWHYGAEAGALTFDENTADVFMKDGTPAASTDYLQVSGRLEPKQADKPEAFGIKRGLADNQIYVWGSGDKLGGRVAVHNTALWAAKSLKEALEKRGIKVGGAAKSVDWKSVERLDAEKAVELASVESKTLAEVVRRMNKNSVNLYAELLVRTLGKRFGDTAPDESRQITELRGDDSAGAAVIRKFLRENNVAADEIQIHDGSGLSRLDLVTPESFGRALIFAAQSRFSDIFTGSLPIAGTDGTLGGRLGNAKGKILGKTGTITFVSSLAGYAQAANGEILAFAIIGNNITRNQDAARLVDRVALALIETDSAKQKTEKEKQPEEKH